MYEERRLRESVNQQPVRNKGEGVKKTKGGQRRPFLPAAERAGQGVMH